MSEQKTKKKWGTEIGFYGLPETWMQQIKCLEEFMQRFYDFYDDARY